MKYKLHNSQTKNHIHSDVIRKMLSMLEGIQDQSNNTLVLNHVILMLEDYDAKQAESEQLLCSLITLILSSFSIHIDQDSTLYTQIKLLQLRLMSPVTTTELVALQHYVESCADNITQLSGLKEKEVSNTLEPLLNSFGLDNKRPSYQGGRLNTEPNSKITGLRGVSLQAIRNGQLVDSNSKIGTDLTSIDKTLTNLMASNYLTNSIAQSEKFGVLLEVELASLKALDDDVSFGEKKDDILKKLENVLGSHQHLTEYFQDMSDFVCELQENSTRLVEELDRVTLLSLTDELTGLPNRRSFAKSLGDEIARVKRYGNSLSLALLDIDYFKPINDQYGHLAGDKVLRHYAQDVLSIFRQHDIVARYGGEEFVVIFPGTDLTGASKALENVKRRAENSYFILNDQEIELPTFSAGLVSFEENESSDDFIHRADLLLYKAKSSGRNCIEVEVKAEVESELTDV